MEKNDDFKDPYGRVLTDKEIRERYVRFKEGYYAEQASHSQDRHRVNEFLKQVETWRVGHIQGDVLERLGQYAIYEADESKRLRKELLELKQKRQGLRAIYEDISWAIKKNIAHWIGYDD